MRKAHPKTPSRSRWRNRGITHALGILFWLWLLTWGGANWLEGWKAWGILGWFAGIWTEDQIRVYALALLVMEVIWFVLGVFQPRLRLPA